jgi:hypothetical protein
MLAAQTAQPDMSASISTLRKHFESYATAKAAEIREAMEAWRYYHGVQWTNQQIQELAKRKQPPITFNRTAPKIDGLVGTIRRLRTDPKAFPRNSDDQEAADLATMVVRYGCDVSNFEDIEAEGARYAATIGIGGCELVLMPGENGDPDVELREVDPRTFFYDPRSLKQDFSDARFMGTYKWVSKDEVNELFPGGSQDIGAGVDGNFTTGFDTDREKGWMDDKGRYKLVQHWYIKNSKWYYCTYVGSKKLEHGESPFKDDKGKPICGLLMFSNGIDHEGDRYGYCRLMRGPQDAINWHRSKAMHAMNTRQLKVRRGAVEDINKLRMEAHKLDGVLEWDVDPTDIEILPNVTEFAENAQFFNDARDEIENFGPNQALLGTGIQAKSGRAMAMMQQVGLAQLGPYLKNFRMWKLSVYRALWGAYRHLWTAERWIRITGKQEAAQFVKVNAMQSDEYGMMQPVNQIGAIDVDIMMEEGPDTENVQGDVFDLLQSLAQNGVPVPPEVFIRLAPLNSETRDELLQMLQNVQQPDPNAEQVNAIAMKDAAEKARKTGSEADNRDADTALKRFDLQRAMQLAGMAEQAMQPPPSLYGQEFVPGDVNASASDSALGFVSPGGR